eukprot:9479166-Pyramimonas_sp.AAC.1
MQGPGGETDRRRTQLPPAPKSARPDARAHQEKRMGQGRRQDGRKAGRGARRLHLVPFPIIPPSSLS